MKQNDWKIIYTKYEGVQKRAVEFLSKEAGRWLIRETGVYRICVLPCEKDGAEIEKNAIVIGLYQESETVKKFVKKEEIPKGGFLIKVCKREVDNGDRIVVITAFDETELFYGAVSFVDDYAHENIFACGNAVRMVEQIFDRPMKAGSFAESPNFATRSVFTWGHPINDYIEYIDNMARLKLNQLIIWNDFVPLNAREVIEYAHSYGIEVLYGYAWGWQEHCCEVLDISDATLKKLQEQIVKEYETQYAPLGCDGIYFQSFTERGDEYIGGRLIAEAVTTLVNNTSRELFEKYPSLKLQFGLHSSSVENRLEEIAKVDKRVEILWEDCARTLKFHKQIKDGKEVGWWEDRGAFPYSYSPNDIDEDKINQSIEVTKKILALRGDAPVGLVLKGAMTLDWSKFVSQRGPFIMGDNASEICEHDKRVRESAWREFSAEWMQNGEYVKRLLECIKENAQGPVNICLAGTFDGGVYFPQAVASQMMRTFDEDYGKTMKRVARRGYVKLG